LPAPSLGRLKFIGKVCGAAPAHLAPRRFDVAETCKIQCADKPLRPKGASERQFALSCRLNRAQSHAVSSLSKQAVLLVSPLRLRARRPRHRRDSLGMRPFAFGAGLSPLHQVGKRDCPSSQRSHHDGIANKHCCRHNLWTAALMLCARHFLSAEHRMKSGNGSRGTHSGSGDARSR
jgi:hypothetical protein